MTTPDSAHVSIFDHAEAPDADATITQQPASIAQEVPLGDVDLFDHGAEQTAVNKSQQDVGVAPPDMPDRQDVPIRNAGVMVESNKDVQEEVQRRFKDMLGNVQVTVTAEDRDAFVRSALHDSELIFEVRHEGLNVVLSVAIPPEVFTNAVFTTLGQMEADGKLEKGNTMLWFLLFQQLHVLFQIRRIDGVPTPWAHLWEAGIPISTKLRDILLNPDYREKIDAMSAVRWRLCMDAIQIAEVKYANCLTNWRDRTFFTGADTA